MAFAKRRRAIPFDWRLRLRRKISEIRYGPGAVTRPLRVYHVDPDRIRYNGQMFAHYEHVGTVRGGKWDQGPTLLTDEPMFLPC